MKKNSKPLMALTAAALSLPGMTVKTANAQTVPEDFSFDYRFTEYQEEAQEASTTNTGESVERYAIEIQQFGIVAPLSSTVVMSLDASTETLSGASPWYIQEDDGQIEQVMSGATIEEERNEISLGTNIYADNQRLGLSITQSTENDYESTSFNANTSKYFNDDNTTLDLSFSFSDDTITPTQDPMGDTRITEDDRNTESYSIALSQVINKTFLIGGGFSYTKSKGYLSDPYKLVSVAGALTEDSRPDTREQIAIDVKARKYFEGIEGAFHTDYRYYTNNWGVNSNTISFGWYQNLGSWQLASSMRYYDQKAANFYSNVFENVRGDGFYSNDYRLSSFGATSYRVGLTKTFIDVGLITIAYENYQSGEGLHSDDDLNPGLVNFDLFTAGFSYKF